MNWIFLDSQRIMYQSVSLQPVQQRDVDMQCCTSRTDGAMMPLRDKA
jgi:hypothetical protein